MDPNIVARALEKIAQLDPDLQITAVLTFLYVAQGRTHQSEIQRLLGTNGATTSRNVAVWTNRRTHGTPGLNMIERYEDPEDRRNKLLRLNAAGKAFYNSLKRQVDGASTRN